MSNVYEIFMPIKKYEDTYAVSNLGRVKNIKTNKILKPFKNNWGYMLVDLYKDGERKTRFVHRLVLETFKANTRNCSDVNHIDENKENNALNNLEWCTRSENINHGTRNARDAEKKSIPVYCITNNTVYKSAKDAGIQLNLDPSNITKCLKGKYNQTKGYQFKYYTEGDLL